MTFLIFEEFESEGENFLRSTGEQFKLAGRNLIYSFWKSIGSPLNCGWHAKSSDLMNIHFAGRSTPPGVRMASDFHPSATNRIGIIEITDVYGYTCGDGEWVEWTPLMFKMKDICYETFMSSLIVGQKQKILAKIPNNKGNADFVEFLHLQGSDGAWNFGVIGGANATFIQGPVRDYFKKFF